LLKEEYFIALQASVKASEVIMNGKIPGVLIP
jgi:hypothetical protein